MENASKALIIAGAILLSILIISLGLMVYQNARNTVGSSNLNKQEISQFNSDWEAVIGTHKSANEVRSIYQSLIAHNAAEEKAGTSRFINIAQGASTGATVATPTANPHVTLPAATALPNSSTYTVTIDYSNEGLVSMIYYQ